MRAAWPLVSASINVCDLEAEVAFYRGLGLTEVSRQGARAGLGTAGRVLLELQGTGGGPGRPVGAAGLYHFALLLPSPADLDDFAAFALASGLPLTSASDHLVSRAIYLEDPEGNGIEVYADRPAATWRRRGARIEMDSIPLDAAALAAESRRRWAGLPAGSLLGHIHLRVADLDRSQAWYEGLGLNLTAAIPGARFLSWDGYHHHVAVNTWHGSGVRRISDAELGWAGFVIDREGAPPALAATDPDGIAIVPAARMSAAHLVGHADAG